MCGRCGHGAKCTESKGETTTVLSIVGALLPGFGSNPSQTIIVRFFERTNLFLQNSGSWPAGTQSEGRQNAHRIDKAVIGAFRETAVGVVLHFVRAEMVEPRRTREECDVLSNQRLHNGQRLG